ncbi:MAG: cytochrome c biogenesis protein CcdA [Anaerolineae bacterium]|nr:cytochrome c biogenesis protein CcdA [Anaerolineae bacterium]
MSEQSKKVNPEPFAPLSVGLSRRGKLATILSFALPALLVVGLLFALVASRDGVESAMTSLSSLLPVGYAFSAGMVASVNPCGFLLLPTYILYHLRTGDPQAGERSASERVLKALAMGLVATAGFVTVFALAGSVVAIGGRWLNAVFPYGRVLVGAIMAVLGIWLLVTGRSFGLQAASRLTIAPRRNMWNVFLFGIIYAVGSLSCTLPIFLVIVGSALVSQEWTSALTQFIGYALGMGLVFVAATIGAALLRQAIVRKLHGAVLYVNRFSALLLVAVGAYLVYDWVAQL